VMEDIGLLVLMSIHHYVSSLILCCQPTLTFKKGWAISTGSKRSDLTSISSLQNSKCGVSRIGSGSYVMSFVLADQNKWLSDSPATNPPFAFTPLQTFAKLREGVNNSEVDFFMWEHFTSKKYYDNGEIKRVGEIYTPWSSWKIVATTIQERFSAAELEEKLEKLFRSLDQGVGYFESNPVESVEYISTNLDYSKEDAQEWLKTVKFTKGTKGVKLDVIEKTTSTLQKAGVLTSNAMAAGNMILYTK